MWNFISKLMRGFLISSSFFSLSYPGKAREISFPVKILPTPEEQDLSLLGKGGKPPPIIENLSVAPKDQPELTSILSTKEPAQLPHTFVTARPHSPQPLLQTTNSSRETPAPSSEAEQFSDVDGEFMDDDLFDNQHLEPSFLDHSFSSSGSEFLYDQIKTSASEQIKELIARSQVEDLTPSEWERILLFDNPLHTPDDEERALTPVSIKEFRPSSCSSGNFEDANFEDDDLKKYDDKTLGRVDNATTLLTTLEQDVAKLFNTQAKILHETGNIVTTCQDAEKETASVSPTSSPRDSSTDSIVDPQLGEFENSGAEGYSSSDTSFNAELYRLIDIGPLPAEADKGCPATEPSAEPFVTDSIEAITLTVTETVSVDTPVTTNSAEITSEALTPTDTSVVETSTGGESMATSTADTTASSADTTASSEESLSLPDAA